jgi:hypothetical protein
LHTLSIKAIIRLPRSAMKALKSSLLAAANAAGVM